jgi:NADH-quinone oxidoreductase subunit L
LKAFFTVRVGDIGLLVGTAIVFFGANEFALEHGSNGFSIQMINEWALEGGGSHALMLWGAVALFIACIGKSGQFPLHTWLPDAMAGPTPVSSLLHSSTMVVAGVFLVARLYPVFHVGLDINVAGQSFNLIAVIGGITILIAAALAFVQTDIKKVLAYSTVSQLGYMMMGLGVGAWTPAVFHIFTHAFFKCCLFLCAGSVAHSGSNHSFEMKDNMGGLSKKMPVTTICWLVSTAALCGIPFFSGFFSKDEIIDSAGHNGYNVFMIVGLIGAFMTAAYMTRATYLTFFGEARGAAAGIDEHAQDAHTAADSHDAHDSHDDHAPADASHGHGGHHAWHGPHESPWLIKGPLIILAALAVVSGYLNAAPWHWHSFEHWVANEEMFEKLGMPGAPEFTWMKAAPSIILVAAGILISLFLSRGVFGSKAFAFKGLTKRVKLLEAGHTFLKNKYYLDHLYEKVIVHGIAHPIAKGANWVNQNVLDGVVNTAGTSTRKLGGWVYRNIDQRVVDGAVNGTGAAARGTGSALRPVQSGKVNQYGALLFGAAAVAALVLVIVNT